MGDKVRADQGLGHGAGMEGTDGHWGGFPGSLGFTSEKWGEPLVCEGCCRRKDPSREG